ncbi:hypothetical protein GLYMA_03G157500v4 [Glycine max]|uniref:Uncharacterized protein n=1 Tax=Glycine max TaxID=3847 RepID=A0A0R0KS42_SOYBN|nr:hypothetical protein GYH30_007361 [Glycine max]KRH67269.1 hypothetical protein GLYMA_03G157500v4 [Glycine max]
MHQYVVISLSYFKFDQMTTWYLVWSKPLTLHSLWTRSPMHDFPIFHTFLFPNGTQYSILQSRMIDLPL